MNHHTRCADSDEEPPAAAAHLTILGSSALVPSAAVRPDVTALLSGTESQMLDELSHKLSTRYKAMTSLPPCVPAVVSFCVGGKNFALSRTLIEKDPGSLLFMLALEHYAPSTCHSCRASTDSFTGREDAEEGVAEAAGITIALPERSPTVCAMLVNMLRGYRNAIPVEWMDCCKEEAVYYGLESSWNARFHALPEAYYFRNPLHNSKMVSDSMLGVASDFLTSGTHHIDFSVAQCDRVGVGVISTTGGGLAELGPQAQDGINGAFYWNDGKLSLYITEPRMVETGFPFPTGAIIRVIFDADARIIRWMVNGEYCVAIERLPEGQQYAFGSIASRSSQVTIVPL